MRASSALRSLALSALLAGTPPLGCSRGSSTRPIGSLEPPTYHLVVTAIARRQAVDDSVATPGARSILLTDGTRTARAILLLHGLTDSPRQFESLAYMLHADGNNVYVPRLPQHGLRGQDARALGALTAAQLRAVADSVVYETRGLADSVIVVGLSMGATLAAWIAEQREITRALLIAPAIEPARIPSILDRPIIGLADRLPSVTRLSPLDSARPDREPGFNTHAAAQIFALGRAVLSQSSGAAPRTHDIVLLLNAGDHTVKGSAAEAMARDWSRHGASVSVFELPDSLRLPHNIIDAIRGRAGGDVVLALLRQLAYGETPSDLVRRLAISAP